jgi:glycosyltransferase involved in cell wall biosynthesis
MIKPPLVSVICPTTPARDSFRPAFLRYYGGQDYRNKELILIDGPGTIGAKRNFGCARARGCIIVHMDDDDFYASDWISRSVDFLLMHPNAEITGLSDLFFKKGEEIWKYTYSYPPHAWVGGATMCYRKSVWERFKFPDKMIGEDCDFQWKSKARIFPHDYIDGFKATIHDGNTYKNNMQLKEWTKIR